VSTLYIIATPIGNLEDITLRALRLLGQVKLIAAEDTRTTRHLLDAYNIKTAVTSYHEHNKLTKLNYILDSLKNGDVALVSEAGMPGLSDTGYELISTAINQGIKVEAIPGASAVIAALVASGLPTDQFLYVGFLPRRKATRIKFIESIAHEARTIVAFESPHRIGDTFADILDILGDRNIAVCRELTKLHEEIFRGTVSRAKEHFNEPRGEFTLVLEGMRHQEIEFSEHISCELKKLYEEGLPAKQAIALISQKSKISKNKLYEAWLRINKGEKACDAGVLQ
jgi:16S rRNA (cytidine1402-2'-O)-methyltransferase